MKKGGAKEDDERGEEYKKEESEKDVKNITGKI